MKTTNRNKKIIGILSVIAVLGWMTYIGTGSSNSIQSSIIAGVWSVNSGIVVSTPKVPKITPALQNMITLVNDFEKNKNSVSDEEKEIYLVKAKELYGEAIKWFYTIKNQNTVNKTVLDHKIRIADLEKEINIYTKAEKDLQNKHKEAKKWKCTEHSKSGACGKRKVNKNEVKKVEKDLKSTKKYLVMLKKELNISNQALSSIVMSEANIKAVQQESEKIFNNVNNYVYTKLPTLFNLSHELVNCRANPKNEIEAIHYCDILVMHESKKYDIISTAAAQEAESAEEDIEISEVVPEEA